MTISDILEKARTVLDELGELDRPVSDLDMSKGAWQRRLGRTGRTEGALDAVGWQLSGGVTAVLQLSRGADQPGELGGPDADGRERACASLVLEARGEGGAGAGGTALTIQARPAAASRIALHRACTPATKAGKALEALVLDLPDPADLGRMARLSPDEAVEVDLEGSLRLVGEASWRGGFARRLVGIPRTDGCKLESAVTLDAGVSAVVTLEAHLEGSLALTVSRGAGAGHARVRWLRRRGTTTGAGVRVRVAAGLSGLDRLLEGHLGRVLEIPDGVVDGFRELLALADEVLARVQALDERARAAIAGIGGALGEGVTVADLRGLLEAVEGLPTRLRTPLEPLAALVSRLLDRYDAVTKPLANLVDRVFEKPQAALATVSEKLTAWLESYDRIRHQAVERLARQAEQGFAADLSAAVHRSHTYEALLDLDLDLARAGEVYRSLLGGDLEPATRAALDPAASGVRLVACALKDALEVERTASLRINLLSWRSSRELVRFRRRVSTAGADGSLTLASEAGARLAQRAGDDVETVSFVCSLVEASQGGATPASFEYRRAITFTSEAAIRALLPRHLAAAERVGLVAGEAAGELRERLEGAAGDYTLGVSFSLDQALVARALLLDQPALGDQRLRAHLWQVFRRALEVADTPVPTVDPARPCPASLLVTSDTVGRITEHPAEPFRAVRRSGYRFEAHGAFVAWQIMLHGHLFIGALLDLRAALLASRELADVAGVAGRTASRLLDQIGAVRGTTVDAAYLLLPLLAGTDLCRLHLVFGRGSGEERVEVTV